MSLNITTPQPSPIHFKPFPPIMSLNITTPQPSPIPFKPFPHTLLYTFAITYTY